MSWKLMLSIAAGFTLSAGVVRAAPASTNAEIYAGESGNPDSVEYRNRMFGRHWPSNEEINAAEVGNPDGLDYRHQMSLTPEKSWQEAWQSVEFGNPDFR